MIALRQLPVLALFLTVSLSARADVLCEETFLDPDNGDPTTISVLLQHPLPGSETRVFGPDCQLEVSGFASTVGIPPELDFYLVIDQSGSTRSSSGLDVDNDGRIDSILRAEILAAEAFIDAVDLTSSRVAIIAFSGPATIRHQLSSNRASLLGALFGLSAGGGTDYSRAMSAALDEHARAHDPSHAQAIVFLSDGQPTEHGFFPPLREPCPFRNNDQCAGVAWAEEAFARGLTVNTFAVGVGASSAVLAEMAERANGQFRDLDVAGEIVTVLPTVTLVGLDGVSVTNITTNTVQEAMLTPDGRFVANVPFAPGLNELTVTARGDSQPWVVHCSTDTTFTCISYECPQDAVASCQGPDGALVTGLDAFADHADVVITNSSPYDDVAPGDHDASGTYPIGNTRVRFTFSDPVAGFATCETRVTVSDSDAPTISNVPPGGTFVCTDVPPRVDPTAEDACDDDLTLIFSDRTTAGGCPDEYTLVREWRFVDDFGNAEVATQRLEVIDGGVPRIDDVPTDLQLGCNDPVPPAASPTATDDCDPAPAISLAEEWTDGPCPGSSVLTRTWTARDRCGQESTASRVIEFLDAGPPRLLGVPADQAVSCDALPAPPVVTAEDDCDAAPTLQPDERRIDGPCADTYVLERSWQAEDACGNVAVATQRLSVSDTAAPTLVGVPPDETASCDAVPAMAVVTAIDTCDPNPAVSATEQRIDGACADSYVLLRTWTANDRCGNSISASQRVTVQDTLAPAVFAELVPLALPDPATPADPSSTCSAPASRAFQVTGSAADACDPDPDLTAVLLVTHHDVLERGGECQERLDVVSVDLGEIVEIRLVAPPCPAKPPRRPESTLAVRSDGVRVVTGERVALAVTALDRCGNDGMAVHDVSDTTPDPCEQELLDGSCCPAIAAPASRCCGLACGE